MPKLHPIGESSHHDDRKPVAGPIVGRSLDACNMVEEPYLDACFTCQKTPLFNVK
jgi:hypothetical protein